MTFKPAVVFDDSSLRSREQLAVARWLSGQSPLLTRLVAGALRLSLNGAEQLGNQAVIHWSRHRQRAVELSVMMVDRKNAEYINRRWRDKHGAFNVLAFALFDGCRPLADEPVLLGDVVVCVPYAIAEANRLERPVTWHVLTLWIHGLLHLLGYDHETDAGAEQMARAEQELWQQAILEIGEETRQNER